MRTFITAIKAPVTRQANGVDGMGVGSFPLILPNRMIPLSIKCNQAVYLIDIHRKANLIEPVEKNKLLGGIKPQIYMYFYSCDGWTLV